VDYQKWVNNGALHSTAKRFSPTALQFDFRENLFRGLVRSVFLVVPGLRERCRPPSNCGNEQIGSTGQGNTTTKGDDEIDHAKVSH
jgi:hypothetical protein